MVVCKSVGCCAVSKVLLRFLGLEDLVGLPMSTVVGRFLERDEPNPPRV